MKSFIAVFFALSLISCKNGKSRSKIDPIVEIKEESLPKAVESVKPKEGYLFVDISDIYHNGGRVVIVDESNRELLSLHDRMINIAGNTFDIIDDYVNYGKSLNVESYFPEYGLFIMKATKNSNENYYLELNGSIAHLDGDEYGEFLTFKTTTQYVLDGYPNPSSSNPIRINPSDDSEILVGYENYTYVSVEIEGDWLKVKDDKECYIGESPSESDIVGWIRWRKDGQLILDVRQIC